MFFSALVLFLFRLNVTVCHLFKGFTSRRHFNTSIEASCFLRKTCKRNFGCCCCKFPIFIQCTKQKLRHYQQASSKLSIQIFKKRFYKKKNQISTETQQPMILRDFVCFTCRRLFKLPTAHRQTTLLTEEI